jgi:CBS domain-containing protein
LLVQEIMTKKIEKINSDETVFEACKKFKQFNLGSLVVEDDDLIVGIITERDVILKIILENKNPTNTLIRDVMTPYPKTIHALAKIEEAAEIMKKNNIKKLPVIYNNNLVGMITDTDISRAVHILSKNQ